MKSVLRKQTGQAMKSESSKRQRLSDEVKGSKKKVKNILQLQNHRRKSEENILCYTYNFNFLF